MTALPVAPPPIPVLADRGGTQLKTPRPVLLVDTREQQRFDFFPFEDWFAGIETRALQLGDYSVAGMEDICLVERKSLSDLVHSFTAERNVFVNRLQLMARYPHRLLVICAALSQVKSPYAHSGIDPNRSAGRAPGAVPLHGKRGVGCRDCRIIPVPGSPLPLARNQ